MVASASKIKSIDPAQANTFGTLQILSALGDTLYSLNKEGELEPKLASGLPTIHNNGLIVRIPLREDVKFHDGTNFDADSMVFSIKRFMKIGILNYIVGNKIKSIEAPEKYLLEIKLKQPSSSLKGILSSTNLTPLSPSSYKDYKNKFLNKNFIGTGPYKLTGFHPQQISLQPFKGYWGEKPKNSGIDLISLSNSAALFSAMQTGEIDVLISNSIHEDHRRALKNFSRQGKFNEGQGPPLEIGYIALRTNSPPLNQESLRHALSYSINRPLISRRVSFGERKPLRSFIPPIFRPIKNSFFWPTYNPEIAEKLFRESGFCSGQRYNLPLTFRSNVPADKLLALTWQAQIQKDLNHCMSISLNGVESTTVYRQLSQGAYEAVILDWRGSYPDPEAYLSPLLSCSKSYKNECTEGEAVIGGSFWTTPGLENSLQKSNQLIGDARNKEIIKIEKKAAKGVPYIPVWSLAPKAWTQPNLGKPEFDGNGHLLLNDLHQKI